MLSRSSKISLAVVGVLIVIGGIMYLYRSITEPDVVILATPTPIVQTGPAYKILGTSVQGRKIESFTYGKGPRKIVFVGGAHGGYEWNSVLLAYQFLDYLDANKTAVPENVSVVVIPTLNPDGVFKVTGKEGRFAITDVSLDTNVLASGRFNANNVDLNRNFDCNWQPKSTWQSRTVDAGTSPFSEPESLALKNFVESEKPEAFVFWHSQADAVYASQCKEGVLTETRAVLDIYAKATGYKAVDEFTSYTITGDMADWLATIQIPAITVELKTHEAIEWEKNLLGIKALIQYYNLKK